MNCNQLKPNVEDDRSAVNWRIQREMIDWTYDGQIAFCPCCSRGVAEAGFKGTGLICAASETVARFLQRTADPLGPRYFRIQTAS
jgi:hypothetical protein